MSQLLNNYIEFVKKFLPKKVESPSFGLDIGNSTCKIVEVIPQEGTFEILNWAIESIENAKVDEALQRLIRKVNFSSKSIVTAISGQGTLVRYIDMPRMSLEDLRNSFQLESDRYFPFPKDKIYTDCAITNAKARDNKMSVLIAAAKREIVDQRIKLLSGLGLQPDFIGLNSIALTNLFQVLKQKQQSAIDFGSTGVFAILDIGEITSSLIILRDYLPAFCRDIFTGGRELTKRINSILNQNAMEGENKKKGQENPDAEILTACESILMNLSSEARLSFDYFATENSVAIGKLFLTGGSAMLRGIEEFFAKNLEIPVERWDSLNHLKIASHISKEELGKNINRLDVALGLAFYQYD